MIERTYALVGYVVVMLAGRLVAHRQRRTRGSVLAQSRAAVRDWTALLTAFSTAIAIALPVLEAALGETAVSNTYMILAGLMIIAAGWGVAYVANRAIGENWSPTIDKDEGQKLITSGVYSLIRHPLYLSGLLVVVGTNVYFESSWAWLGALAASVAVLLRLPLEERRLVERFGKAYTVYQKRTRAVLPWLL